jgi:hypothetical protein
MVFTPYWGIVSLHYYRGDSLDFTLPNENEVNPKLAMTDFAMKSRLFMPFLF